MKRVREDLGRFQFGPVQNVCVEVCRGGDGTVPQQSGHHFEVHAVGQEQGGVRVAQAVQGQVREGCVLHELLELPFHVVVVYILSGGGGEYHLRVFKVLAALDLQALLVPLLFQQASHVLAHRQLADRGPRLGGRKRVLAGHVRQVPPHVDDAPREVYVFPHQAEGLAGAHARQEQETDDHVEPVVVSGHPEELPGLFFGQVGLLLLRRGVISGKDDVVAGVGLQEAVLDGHPADASERHMHTLDRRGRCIYPCKVLRQHAVVQVGQGQIAQARQNVLLQVVFVVIDRDLFQALFGVVGPVPGHIFIQCDVLHRRYSLSTRNRGVLLLYCFLNMCKSGIDKPKGVCFLYALSLAPRAVHPLS